MQFYAAAPIRIRDGHHLGTVNVIAGQPRTVTTSKLDVLTCLADIVAELEVRLNDVDADSWALVVGDVCGKGPYPAAATGEIRAALRAIARVQPNPRDVLVSVNEVLCRDGLDVGAGDAMSKLFCTIGAVCARDAGPHVAVNAVYAGHPLALVRRRDGGVEPFGSPGQLLGVLPDLEVNETAGFLEDGDMLLLYTDGAVEQRGGRRSPVGQPCGCHAMMATIAFAI